MSALWILGFVVVFLGLLVFFTRDKRRKPKPEQIETYVFEELISEPEPVRPEPEPDEGRGAYAILNRAARARVRAVPGRGAPEGITYHVVRQRNRELAVVAREKDEQATDRIVTRFAEHEGIQAWDKRNQLQYGGM